MQSIWFVITLMFDIIGFLAVLTGFSISVIVQGMERDVKVKKLKMASFYCFIIGIILIMIH